MRSRVRRVDPRSALPNFRPFWVASWWSRIHQDVLARPFPTHAEAIAHADRMARRG